MYQLMQKKPNRLEVDVIKRIADNAFIPVDPANTDYQAYLAWVAEGNQPLPAEEQL